jgi:hypothetical protein
LRLTEAQDPFTGVQDFCSLHITVTKQRGKYKPLFYSNRRKEHAESHGSIIQFATEENSTLSHMVLLFYLFLTNNAVQALHNNSDAYSQLVFNKALV